MTLLLLLACKNPAPSPPGATGSHLVESGDTATVATPTAALVHEDGTMPVDGELPRVLVHYGPTAEQFVEPRLQVWAPAEPFGVAVDGSATSEDGPDYVGTGAPAYDTNEGDSTFWVRLHAKREPNSLQRQCEQRGTLATLSMAVEVRTEETTWAPVDVVSEVLLVSDAFLDELCADEGY